MDYILTYIVGSFAGWIFEAVQQKKNCDRILEKFNFGCWPVLQIYGFTLSILLFIWRSYKQNIFVLVLSALFLPSVIECLGGNLSEFLFGKRGWTYQKFDFCNRYLSLPTSITWFTLSIISFFIFSFLNI